MTRQTQSEQLAALTAIVERIDKRAEEDRALRQSETAAAQRGREAVRTEIQRHGLQIESLEGRIAKIEPVADMATGLKAKFVGALFVLGLIGSVIMTTLALFRERLLNVIGG